MNGLIKELKKQWICLISCIVVIVAWVGFCIFKDILIGMMWPAVAGICFIVITNTLK